MLTPQMIEAENFTVAITVPQKLNLLVLVKAAFASYVHVWSQALENAIDEEMSTPTEKTQVLKAVLTQLGTLPAEVIESSGSSDRPSFFTTPDNWKSLALDVLNILNIQVLLSHQSYGVQQRTVDDLILKDDIQLSLKPSRVGKRY